MPRAKKAPVVPVGTGRNEKMPDVAPGGAYGSRLATETAIHAAPLAQGSVPPVAPMDAAAQLAAPPQGDPLAAAQNYNPDGPGLLDPSQHPNEPVTAGLASGPGAGPGVLAMPDPTQADVQTWHSYLPTLEYLASQPGSTQSTRSFVRQLRAAMPQSSALQ